MQGPIQVCATYDTPGLRYVLSFVFETWYGCSYELMLHPDQVDAGRLVINYSAHNIPGAFNIPQAGIPFDTAQPAFPEVSLSDWAGIPCFFSQSGGDIPFDLFGAIFFLLARVEEYKDGSRDAHKRFLAVHSVFAGSGLIERPIVDEWLVALGEVLSKKSSDFNPKPREYKWLNTFDIDVAYAYKYRSIYRLLGGISRDVLGLDFSRLKKRFRVLFDKEVDPFDTYAYQMEIAKKHRAESTYFFLLGDLGRFDKNISHRSTGLRNLIGKVSMYADVGIHPSYASNGDLERLKTEISRLHTILKADVQKSRQHYLKVELPRTYRDLMAAGILEDYSLGYVDRPGFRSGTCTPHYFFDFQKQEATALRVFPLAAMDATLRDYMGQKPREAEARLTELIARVKAVNGTFVSLWHNDSLSDLEPWKGWRDVYAFMAETAASDGPPTD